MARKTKITVHPLFTVGEISPRLFSAFLEPIGTMVNGSMYNPKHPSADEQGFRQDWMQGLKEAGLIAVRLPGGNYVSCWNWKDSIGPREGRKAHLDMAWHQYITNEVGHDEYLQWAEKIGAEPLYTVNLGTGGLQDAIDLVEYTNHEGGTWWSDLRRKNGHEKPYGVKTWYLGNEMDGPWQLGSWEKDPKGYGVLCNETSKAMKWVDETIETAVCGSSAPFMAHYPQWEEEVFSQCYETVDYLSLHHYHIAPPGDFKALLGGSVFYEDFIRTEIAMCDLVQAKMRSPKKMMISFDEYGTMAIPNARLHPGYGPHNMAATHYRFDPERKYVRHDPDRMEERAFPGGDMLHALTLASTQLAFLHHADRVKIGCMTSGLNALCSSNHDHVWKSASHYVLTQLMQYARGMSLETAVEGETFDIPGYAINDTSEYPDKEGVNWVDAACAWERKEGSLHLFVLNKNPQEDYPLEINVSAFRDCTFLKHLALYSEDFDARNSYETPDRIQPRQETSAVFRDGYLTARLKPLSWNVFCFRADADPAHS